MRKKTFRIPRGILFFLFLSVIMVSFIATRTTEFHRSPETIVQSQLDQPSATVVEMYSEFAVHEDTSGHEAANLMQNQGIKGYIVWTEGIGANPYDYSGRDYNSNTVNFGHKAIVRLNYGYGIAGTIPDTSQYNDFAQRCANFVSNSTGCSIWIIGNEMNNSREWPGGTPIQPTNYATCFNLCYTKIKEVQPNAIVMPGAIDGYNADSGDPRTYASTVYSNLTNYDAICVHSYTHGPDPSLISADTYFENAPLLGVHFDFKNFEDILAALPVGSSQKDVYITETNHLTLEVAPSGTNGWVDQNIGWIQTMYDYVRNVSPYKQRIRCAALYRWPNVDAWVITGKSNLIQDFIQAMQAYDPPSNDSVHLDVFARGTNNNIYHRWQLDGPWSSWESLGAPPGGATSDPSAVCWGSGRVDLFVRGGDYALWHKWFNGSYWGSWVSLGGYITSAPDAASWGEGHIDVFVRGNDNALYYKRYQNGYWSGWQWLGGVLTSGPSAVSPKANQVYVFVRGDDNALYYRMYLNGYWYGWQSLGGVLQGSPDAASWGENHLDVFVRGNDNYLYHRWTVGGPWSGWESLGTPPGLVIWGPPGAVSPLYNRVDAFVCGSDNKVWHRYFNGSYWGGWEKLDGLTITGGPDVASWSLQK